MDIDMSIKSIGWVFALTVAGLLAVGMGIYLPPSLQTPLVIGAVMGYFLNKKLKDSKGEEGMQNGMRRGTLFASGLIVGESLIGVALAAIIVVSVSSGCSDSPLALVGSDFADTAEFLGLIVFLITLAIFGKTVLGNKNN